MADQNNPEHRLRRAIEVYEEVGDYDTDMSDLEEPHPEPPPYDEVLREIAEELPTYEERPVEIHNEY
jgi:hypothetical protein